MVQAAPGAIVAAGAVTTLGCGNRGGWRGGCGTVRPSSLSVRTAFVLRSMARMAWLFVSATYSVSPATLRPPGSLNSGTLSLKPPRVLPASVCTVRARARRP